MFNTIGRAQGWSDTPLTDEGERGIRQLGLGLKDAGTTFKAAFSSDSGRTIQPKKSIDCHAMTDNDNISTTLSINLFSDGCKTIPNALKKLV